MLKENRDKPRYPVVTLVLYFGYEKRWDKPTTLYEALNVNDLFKPFVSDVRINLFEIAYLTREQVSLFKSDFKIVADYFVQMRESGEYRPSADQLRHVQETLQLLRVMADDRRFEAAFIEEPGKGEVRNMCEWLDRVENRSIAIGEARGEAKKAREVAISMYKRGMNPKDIADILNEALSNVQQWLSVLPTEQPSL